MMVMRAAVVAVVVLASGAARADVRTFTRVWEYSSVPEGKTTIDLWHTQGERTFLQTVEIEHGITDSLDVALLTTFTESADVGTFGLAETRIAARYRFADRGEWPVDTMVHVSAAKEFGERDYRVAAKLVGAREFDRLLLAVNGTVEFGFGSDVDDQPDVTYGAAAGASYQVHRVLRLGAEGWARFGDITPVTVGPVVSWWPTTNFWFTVGAAFGVTDDAEDVTVRGILGLEL